MLSLLGGALGLGLAYAGIRGLVALAPSGLPRLQEIGIDPLVLLFTLAVSLFAGLLFGLLPVARFATPRLASTLNQGGRSGTASRQRHRARNSLVIAEIALAVVLLVASGLMIRTFQAMRHVDPGFRDPAQLVSLRISIPEAMIKDPMQVARTHEQIAHRLEQIPGVQSVGLTSSVPMDASGEHDPIFVEDFPGPGGRIPPIRKFKMVEDGYFRTLGARLVAGRTLTWADSLTQAPVVAISESLAREYWKDPAAALGRRIRNRPDAAWQTIVGIVGDERDEGLAKPVTPIVYWPLVIPKFWNEETNVQRSVSYVLRTERAKSPTLLKEIQQAVWSVNGGLPVANVRTMSEIMSRVDGPDLVRADHAGDRRRRRAPPRHRRHLGRDRVHRGAADEGNRDPDGAGGGHPRRHRSVPAPGAGAGRDRYRDRPGRRRCRDASHVHPALRRRPPGSGDIRRRGARARADGAACLVRSRGAGGARGSGGGVAAGGIAVPAGFRVHGAGFKVRTRRAGSGKREVRGGRSRMPAS